MIEVIVGGGMDVEEALGKQVFDIPQIQCKSCIEPHGMNDQFRWEAMAVE